MARSVVITSMGVVSPIGANLSRFEENLFAGKSGIKNILGELVPKNFPIPYAGIIDPVEIKESIYFDQSELLKKSALYSVIATEECLQNIPEKLNFDAIVYATSESINFENVQKTLFENDFSEVDTYKNESILERIKYILKENS